LILDGWSLTIRFSAMLFSWSRKTDLPLYPIIFVAEFGLSLWLLIKGAKDQELVPVQAK